MRPPRSAGFGPGTFPKLDADDLARNRRRELQKAGYNGIAPFVARLLFDGDLLLAFTSRLPAPWWWIASLAVVGIAVVLLTVIDQAKQRRLAED